MWGILPHKIYTGDNYFQKDSDPYRERSGTDWTVANHTQQTVSSYIVRGSLSMLYCRYAMCVRELSYEGDKNCDVGFVFM